MSISVTHAAAEVYIAKVNRALLLRYAIAALFGLALSVDYFREFVLPNWFYPHPFIVISGFSQSDWPHAKTMFTQADFLYTCLVFIDNSIPTVLCTAFFCCSLVKLGKVCKNNTAICISIKAAWTLMFLFAGFLIHLNLGRIFGWTFEAQSMYCF